MLDNSFISCTLLSVENETLKKAPIVRGVLNFIYSLVLGMRSLMYSASFFEDEDETKKKEESEKAKKKENLAKQKKQNDIHFHYSLAAKAYNDAERLVSQYENYNHLDELNAMYDEAKRRAEETEAREREQAIREQEEADAYAKKIKAEKKAAKSKKK